MGVMNETKWLALRRRITLHGGKWKRTEAPKLRTVTRAAPQKARKKIKRKVKEARPKPLEEIVIEMPEACVEEVPEPTPATGNCRWLWVLSALLLVGILVWCLSRPEVTKPNVNDVREVIPIPDGSPREVGPPPAACTPIKALAAAGLAGVGALERKGDSIHASQEQVQV